MRVELVWQWRAAAVAEEETAWKKPWKPTSTMHCTAGREGEGLLLLRERA
jgi:hypothetical protein